MNNYPIYDPVDVLEHRSLREWQCQFDATLFDRIVLSKDKENNLVEITLPKDNTQIFASQYCLYLPTKAEFQAQIDGVRVNL